MGNAHILDFFAYFWAVSLCSASNADFLCEVFCLSSFIQVDGGVVIFTAGFDLPHAHTFRNEKKAGKYQTHSRRHPARKSHPSREAVYFFHSLCVFRSPRAVVVVCSIVVCGIYCTISTRLAGEFD